MTHWFININKHIIGKNARHGTKEPPVRISKGKSGKGTYCMRASIPDGSEILYDPDKPILKCGARLVIRCTSEPEVIE